MLRYKGKPNLGANKQVDKLPSLCFCRFIAVGVAMDQKDCETHTKDSYRCDVRGCTCYDYRPNAIKTAPNHWPRCVCGHISQEHN